MRLYIPILRDYNILTVADDVNFNVRLALNRLVYSQMTDVISVKNDEKRNFLIKSSTESSLVLFAGSCLPIFHTI